jgi:glycosyltransferase involved in cell wall biosynthesis
VGKTRISHVITGLNTGGAEVMLANLIAGMADGDYDAEVISLTDEGAVAPRIRALGVNVRALGMQPGRLNLGKVLKLSGWLREWRPHLIQSWMYHANLAAGVAARLAGGLPVVWGIHAGYLDRRELSRHTQLIIRLSALAARVLPRSIVCCSQASFDLHRSLGYPAEKMRVIPNGIATNTFVPDRSARASLRDELGVSETTLLIGMVARFDPQKDHANFIRAAALLHRQMPEVRFVLCGNGVTRENPDLMRWIGATGIASHFFLLGERQDVPRVLAGLDLASMSSSFGEAFPLSVCEAMACGIPCVVTNVGDTNLIVGDTGRVVPPGDPEALAGAWAQVLAQEEPERRRIGETARQRIQMQFSLSIASGRYVSLYRELIAQRLPGMAQ